MTFKYTDFFDPKDISIARCWAVVAVALFKDNPVSKVQHDEMRKTFYIGFTECFKIMTDLAGDLSEEEAANVLKRISDEASAFHLKTMAEFRGQQG